MDGLVDACRRYPRAAADWSDRLLADIADSAKEN